MKATGVLTVLLVLAAEAALAWSPKLSLRDDVWIQFGLLAQGMHEAKEANTGPVDPRTGERDEWSNEVFVRRVRMLAQGAFHEKVRFYLSSDSPNLGKQFNENDIVLNDALLDVTLLAQARLLAGRVLVPFSFENLQGAGAVLGIDYNLNALKIPPYLKAAFRDDGAELTGVLLGNYVEYRAGMFAGDRDETTPYGGPRIAGRVMLNLADPQLGWFYFANALGTRKTASIGAGVDHQENGGPQGTDYHAWVVDAVFDRPLSPTQTLSLAGAFYAWRHANDDFTGETASLQGGWLLWNRVQPVVRWERQSPDGGRDLDTYHVGLNVYLKGYNANVKMDWALGDRRDAAGRYEDAVRLQVQVLL